MFERFTERARQVVVLAQEEARSMRHNYIGTEHILMGVLREDVGVGAQVLKECGVYADPTAKAVLTAVPAGEDEVTGQQIPFTPRAKAALELALREALALGHNYIGTEHVLLGLVRDHEGLAVELLSASGVDAQKVRNVVVRLLNHGSGSNADRWEEYQLCKRRGHVPQEYNGVPAVSPPKNRCRYCGTTYWSEVVDMESGAPIEPTVEGVQDAA